MNLRAALALAVCLAASAAAVLGAAQLRPEVDFVDTVPADEPGLAEYRELLERLDGVRFVVVHMAGDPTGVGGGDLRSDAGFDALALDQRDLTARLESSFPGSFTHTLSVYEAMRQGNYMLQKVATSGNPPASAYALPSDPGSQRYVRDQVRGDAGKDVLAADGSSSLLLAFLATHDQDEARTLAGDIEDDIAAWAKERPDQQRATQDPQASGLLVVSHATDERNRHDLAVWGLASTAAVAVATWLVVRRVTNVLIAAASLGVGILWTFGLVGALGIPVSFLTVFLAPLVTGVGVDYAIHLLQRYEEERDAGHDRSAALRTAWAHNTPAVLLSGAITAGSLFVLLLVPNPLFAQMGGVAALGIACGVVASLTLAPALRAILPERRRRLPRPARVGPAVAAVGAWSLRNPLAVFGLVALLTAGAAFTAATQTRLEAGSSATEVPADDPQVVLQRRIETEYGSFQRAYLVVEGDFTNPAALRAIQESQARAARIPLTAEASSITDLLVADEATDQGLVDILVGSAQQPSDAEQLPQTQAEARSDLDALFNDPLWRTIAPFTIVREALPGGAMTYPFGVVALKLEVTEDRGDLVAFRDALRSEAATLQQVLGPQYHVAAAGAPLNRVAVTEQTPSNVQLAVLGSAAVVLVGLGLSWCWRRAGLRTALLSTAVVLTAALWLLASIPLLDGVYRATGTGNSAALTDMVLLAFAITVSVGVDNLVHIAHRDWEHRKAGLPAAVARIEALRHGGGAVVGTSLTTFVAFAVLSGVYFLQSKNLAILTALGVLYTTLLTVLLAPWILKAKGSKSTGWLP